MWFIHRHVRPSKAGGSLPLSDLTIASKSIPATLRGSVECCRVGYQAPDAAQRLTDALLHLLPVDRPILVACVGTDRSTGDALGPLVGSGLARHFPASVIGTVSSPLHAANMEARLTELQRVRNAYVIAVDASLGADDAVGTITLRQGPLLPGAGVRKTLPPIGACHLTGVVNVGGFMEYVVLQNTRLHLVLSMAEVIVAALTQALLHSTKPHDSTVSLPALDGATASRNTSSSSGLSTREDRPEWISFA